MVLTTNGVDFSLFRMHVCCKIVVVVVVIMAYTTNRHYENDV